MPRFPKPFFRRSRALWYVQIGGKQINLGPDRGTAFEQYHKLMGSESRSSQATAVRRDDRRFVVEIIDEFLEHCQIQNSQATYQWYRHRLQGFVTAISPLLTVDDLRPFHVQRWIDAHPGWANGTRRIAIRAIKRAMRWVEEQALIEKSPIAAMRKPPGGRRELVVSLLEFREILEHARNREFRELLSVTWETGCRPQESLRVEARHVDRLNQRWVFPKSESKNTKLSRVVYLTPAAFAITQRRIALFPTGPLLRNSQGCPWTSEPVNCQFRAVRQRIGINRIAEQGITLNQEDMQHLLRSVRREKTENGRRRLKTDGEMISEARRKLRQRIACRMVPNYSLYALRHSFATHALERGVDSLTVAILMGHSDPSMLAKVYQHLALNPQHLRSQLEKAVG